MSALTSRDRALASASPAAITASVWRQPLAGVATHVTVPEGVSLAELVATAFPEPEHRCFVVVMVDGEEVPEAEWTRSVCAGEAVSLVFRAGKDFFRAVLQIAVIAVAAWVGGPAGVSVLGTWGAAVAAAGVAIVGNLIINTLVPLKLPGAGQLAAPDPFYSVTGARNSAALYEPFPILLGRHRIVPRLWGKPVQETFGDKVYLRYALALGVTPMAVSDWKIGETSLEEYDGVDLELRLTEDAPPHTLYTGDPEQTPGGAQLNHTDWVTLTTATDADEIELVYGFRGGLGAIDSKNRKVSRTVSFHIEYRPHGSSHAWQSYRPSTRQANLAAAAAGAPYRPDYFGVHPDLEEWVDGLDGIGAVSNTPYSVTRADPGRPFQRAVRFSVPRGQYDVRTIRTAAQSGDAAVSDGAHFEYLTSIRSAVDPFPNRKIASAVVRVLASDQLSGVIDTINCIAESLQPVFSTEALEEPADADADSLEAAAASSNPAHLALLVARGAQNRRPKPDDEIDWPAWADFAARCAAAGLTFNEYVTSKVGRWELLRRICTAGYARPVKHGGRLSVVMDRLRTGEAPSQAFSGRNVRGFRWRKTFPREVHALRVGFANADNGWQADEVIVYLPGWTEETASIFEQLPLPGKTNPDEVRTVANQYARNAVFQTEAFEFETDAEYLVSKRGDYVVISHHAMAVGLGAARVVAREIDGGGDVTAVVLDAPVATESGPSLALQWRTVKVDGGSARMEVLGEEAVTRDATNPNRFVFVTPLDAAAAPVAADGDEEGDIALVGVATKVSIEALVTEIEPRPHLQAAVRCIAYAPERFVEAPDWDAHNPKVTLPFGPRPDAPLELASVARSLEIAVGFDAPALPAGLELVGFEAAVRETGATEDGWSPLGTLGPDERVAVAPPGDPGADYDVRIVTVARRADGILVRSDALVVEEIAANATPTAPAACAASFVERTSSGGAKQLVLNATWTANEDPEILDTVVEQLVSTGPDVWQEIGRGRAAAGRCEVHGLAVGRNYDLGFVNLSRRGAPSTRTTIATVAAPDTLVATGAIGAAPGGALDDALDDIDSALATADSRLDDAEDDLALQGTAIGSLETVTDGHATSISGLQAKTNAGVNLVPHASLAEAAAGWSLSNASGAFSGAIGDYVSGSLAGSGYIQGFSETFDVTAGEPYHFAVNAGGAWTGGIVVAGLWFYEADDDFIGSGCNVSATSGAGYPRLSATGLAPSGATKARVYFYAQDITGYAIWFKPKAEYGSTGTIWTDDATAAAALARITEVESVNSDQDSAIAVIDSRMDAAETDIDGVQSTASNLSTRMAAVDGGSASATSIAQLVASTGSGANLLRNATLADADPNGGFGIAVEGWTAFASAGSSSAILGVSGEDLNADFPPAGERAFIVGRSGAGSSDYYEWTSERFSVEAGKRYIASASAAPLNCWCLAYLVAWDENNDYVGISALTAYANPGGFPDGALGDFQRVSVAYTIPAGATNVTLHLQVNNAGSNPNYTTFLYATLLRPMVEEARQAQTTPSPWSPGINDANRAAVFDHEARVTTAEEAIVDEASARAAFQTAAEAEFDDINAEVSTQGGAIATINGAAAFWETVVAAGGGDLAAVRLKAGASGSFLEVIGTVLRLANVSNGAVVEVMRAVGGLAFFSNPISIDFGGARMTLGPGYGVEDEEVFLWVGDDDVAPSAQSRSNGAFAIGSDKKVYYGAAELAPSAPPAVGVTDVVEINSTSDQELCSAVVGPTATGDRIRVSVFLNSEEEAAGGTAMVWSVYFGTTLLATGALTITSAGEIVFTDDPADVLRGSFGVAHSGPDTIYLYLRKTNGGHDDRNVAGELFVEVMRTDFSVLLP